MEAAAKEYEALTQSTLDRLTRRLLKRYSDLSKDYEALGGAYNAFSLNENTGSLPLAIERVGQACDATYLSLSELVGGLAAGFAEPLSESGAWAEILRGVLRYRRQKAVQLEITRETLAAKVAQLGTLEKSEQEARRIEHNLARIEGSQILPRQQARQQLAVETSSSSYGTGSYGGSYGGSSGELGSPPTSAVDPPSSPEIERDEDDVQTSPSKAKPKKRLSGVGKVFGFGKLNYAMKGIIDVDPETTRRNNIGKTKETISQVRAPPTTLLSFVGGLTWGIVGIVAGGVGGGCENRV
jgi:sorting nexin-41/42